MEKIKIWNDNPSHKQCRDIAAALRDGEIIIIPTDSVYGLACDALNIKAVNELCRIKNIDPEKNHLSIICPDISSAAEYTHIDNIGFSLLKRLTPGPFTFIFRASHKLPKAFKGRKSVGIRIPDCATPREIASALGNPILTTSIEFSDDDEAREPELIAERYSARGISLMVEGEEGGNELTTVVDLRNSDTIEIIRQGKGEFVE